MLREKSGVSWDIYRHLHLHATHSSLPPSPFLIDVTPRYPLSETRPVQRLFIDSAGAVAELEVLIHKTVYLALGILWSNEQMIFAVFT